LYFQGVKTLGLQPLQPQLNRHPLQYPLQLSGGGGCAVGTDAFCPLAFFRDLKKERSLGADFRLVPLPQKYRFPKAIAN
jgi:hypothetical protein